MLAWLQHAFGFARGDGNSESYLFWSGIGSDLAYLSFLAAGITLYRKHNCRVNWCWRIGRHEITDPASGVKSLLCWKHHPDVTRRTLTGGGLRDLQRRYHLHAGQQPGKG